MQRLNDAGKSGLTTIDIIIRTAAVDQGPQQSRRTNQLSEQMLQHQIRRYQLCVVYTDNRGRGIYTIAPTITLLDSHACTSPSRKKNSTPFSFRPE
ncbi:hypothetical protein TNCV_1643591 [Trichonephila clavipes]|nr:hypothetical protein TNCV_1643591 [Trichonephila clavipes]